ncbi:lipocalin-like domain-containing protein [Roseinatronobacter sp.]|uniref:lipocalin-like domain-containing protein n=1 Tax=Roseinatronobacter sp. TaxID=1945755 RepID=UPI003F6E8E4C
MRSRHYSNKGLHYPAPILGPITALLLIVTATQGGAQGFAGLGTTADGFAVPERGRALEFPQDHGAHPDYRIEWWYLTATLTGDDGQDYGVQWTLFRSALQPGDKVGFSSPQIWMGHAGLTTPDSHFAAETFARGGTGQAGVTPDPFTAFIDDWHMTSRADANADPYDRLDVHATGQVFAFDLTAQATGPLVFHGDQGYSVKSFDGQASYYYSQPFYDISGTLHLPDGPVSVSGQGWLDREWSSQPLSDDQEGWDWFSLGFDDGHRMMGFQLRGAQVFTAGTWITPDGTATPLPPDALQFTPLGTEQVAGRDVPVRWQVDWPEGGVSVTTTPLNPQAWMDLSVSYWEGPLRFSGSHEGRGYLEMTGY